MTLLATIIVLGVLIFVHELGHFLAARSVGIGVERFSIGLGPRVWGYRRGETEYVLSAIPLGGYVKMAGMEDEMMEAIEGGADQREDGEGGEEEPFPSRRRPRPSDFDAKPVWARAWVISAGVIMNMLFAFLAYTAVAAGWGSAELDTTRIGRVEAGSLPAEAAALAEIPMGASLEQVGGRTVSHTGQVREAILEAAPGPLEIRFTDPEGRVTVELPEQREARERITGALGFWTEPELDFVTPGSPADRAGLQAGDRIVAIDGEEVLVWADLQSLIQDRPEQEVRITVMRDGGELTRTVTPDGVAAQAEDGQQTTVGRIGVGPVMPPTAYQPVPPAQAVTVGWDRTVYITGFILGFLRDLVTGQVSLRNLGSIVTIGEASGRAAAEGIPVFLSFMALFSVNLAILNLLPIPVLDGGHLVFLGIEAVRGRPVSPKQKMRWSQVGFFVLVGIMALALGNDFLRLFGL